MITLKFGGTSMADAARISDSATIMASRAREDRVSVVVSAAAGVSDRLLTSIESCVRGEDWLPFVSSLRQTQEDILSGLAGLCPAFDAQEVREALVPIFDEYTKLLSAVAAFGECPPRVHARIMGMGELLSVAILEALLRRMGKDVALVDSRTCIFTTGRCDEGDPDYGRSEAALTPYREGGARILLFPGFICNWRDTGVGLLGRNGSDFSAAIIAYGLNASRVEFWTDVDGIFTADPRIVRDAFLVEDVSYEEAMELSFFGSKVLHPKTLAPLSTRGIEAWSLNTFNPQARGTRITSLEKIRSSRSAGEAQAVRGISCLKDTAMVSVSGAGMKGRTGTAARVFASVSRGGISLLLITQSSSEYTISFCVKRREAREVRSILEAEFELEIRENLINPIEVIEDCAVVSIIGDGMRQAKGIAATFFNALAFGGVNVLAIAQGSSERSISAVIQGEKGDTAVRVCHRFLFNTAQTIEVFVFGAGSIGGCLLDQIYGQQSDLRHQRIDVRVMGICRSKKMLLSKTGEGLSLSSWRKDLEASAEPSSLESVLAFVERAKPLNPVFVDCTASKDLPARYLDVLAAGLHIATPNKRANSMSMDYYKRLRLMANKQRRRFLYETNVGAGLPVIDTLQNLFKSGDTLTAFSGVMSGSLSYIFGRLDEGVPFSRAVLEAREKRFTEPDPRDDLSGLDVARKALIIAREAGFSLELEDVKVSKALPPGFDDSGTTEEFLANLPGADDYFAAYISRLKAEEKALRMGAVIENGACSVGMFEVDKTHPLYAVRGGENAFVFTTARYSPIPLCVRGYGAGAQVTAAGVFGDILRTVSWTPEA
ncbi:MAG: bifunctional aspartate kinase/homoserine dehydrogenase I [Spirochaetaceae bacterium]|jgi:aspartokinase/homoserine dehydrogenase 1|nr:bifunctional aspartate kinase/homoserine dehydrogenase I [Spirochaetaceae bacterium]